jgi:6-phosphogluconolactonase
VLALSEAGAYQIPAAGARGRSRTLMLLDQAAAARLPKGLDRRASS